MHAQNGHQCMTRNACADDVHTAYAADFFNIVVMNIYHSLVVEAGGHMPAGTGCVMFAFYLLAVWLPAC